MNPTPDHVDHAAESLLHRVMDFGRVLKAKGFNITPGRMVDACRSLRHLDLIHREDFRLALRLNLVASHAEEALFDRLFAEFWLIKKIKSQTKEDEPANADNTSSTVQQVQEKPSGDPIEYGREEILGIKDLQSEWPGDSAEAKAVLRELLRRMATRRSRRYVPDRRGRRVDLRRSMRRNIKHGIDILELARVDQKIRKTRVALLCDVSGSMDTYNPFLLTLLLGLQKATKNSRTVVFSTQATDISQALRRQSVPEALEDIAHLAQDWSGGTNIGLALAYLNKILFQDGNSRSTIGLIISDGFDQGDPELIEREMKTLRRLTRKIIWINPLIGTEGYEPTARGIAAALPYIDHFVPANDLPSLRALCQTLSKV